jgi:hypothetical protein
MSNQPTATRPTERSTGIDNLRVFITLLVLAFHAALAHTTFAIFDRANYLTGSTAPIIDNQRWIGFDIFFAFNNTFFMSLMFFISGLFVYKSLEKKGWRLFLQDRFMRLGIPFIFAIMILSPLEYYPSYMRTGPTTTGYFAYWREMILVGPWPCGPLWFVSLLFAFNLLTIIFYKLIPVNSISSATGLNRLSATLLNRPIALFLVLLLATLVAYVPMAWIVPPFRWWMFGPFSLHASRLFLYPLYFVFGLAVGSYGIDRTALAYNGSVARLWLLWLSLSVVAFFWFLAASNKLYAHYTFSEPWAPPEHWFEMSCAYSTTCATLSLTFLSLFQRFGCWQNPVLESLKANAYGIYIIHYAILVWSQYTLVEIQMPVPAKAVLVFTITLLASWGIIAAIRRFSFARAII